jgi:hypothetical protein
VFIWLLGLPLLPGLRGLLLFTAISPANGQAQKADWTIVFHVTFVFTTSISSDKASFDFLHLALAYNLRFCAC